MGYDIDLLPMSVRKKLGLKPVSPAKQMLYRQGALKMLMMIYRIYPFNEKTN